MNWWCKNCGEKHNHHPWKKVNCPGCGEKRWVNSTARLPDDVKEQWD